MTFLVTLTTGVWTPPPVTLPVPVEVPRIVLFDNENFGGRSLVLGDDLRLGERSRAIGPEEAPGMIEVEMAQGHDIHALWHEADGLEHGRDPRTLIAPHRSRLVIEPLADPGLDHDATGRRLDQQAVERLEQPPLLVDFVRDEVAPQDPRNGTEQVAGV